MMPHIHLNGSRAAESLKLAFLNHSQQLRLKFQRQFADLVEKDGGFVGEFEASNLAPVAPVNAPFSCPNSSLSTSVGVSARCLLSRVADPSASLSCEWHARQVPFQCRFLQ